MWVPGPSCVRRVRAREGWDRVAVTRRSVALLLLALALVLLWAGGFLALDDIDGFGHEAWLLPVGALAALAAVAAVAVALSDPLCAGRAVGWALAVLVGTVVALDVVDPGLRFVWTDGEGELRMLQAALVVVAVGLLVGGRGRRPTGGLRRTTGTWLVLWLLGTVVAVVVAFLVGAARFEATECAGAEVECDIAGIAGALWAAVALVACLLACGADALRRRLARRRLSRRG